MWVWNQKFTIMKYQWQSLFYPGMQLLPGWQLRRIRPAHMAALFAGDKDIAKEHHFLSKFSLNTGEGWLGIRVPLVLTISLVLIKWNLRENRHSQWGLLSLVTSVFLHLHSCTLISVWAMIEIDSQFVAAHMFLHLLFPVMDQGSGTDDKCSMGSKLGGVSRGGKNQHLVTPIK